MLIKPKILSTVSCPNHFKNLPKLHQ